MDTHTTRRLSPLAGYPKGNSEDAARKAGARMEKHAEVPIAIGRR